MASLTNIAKNRLIPGIGGNYYGVGAFTYTSATVGPVLSMFDKFSAGLSNIAKHAGSIINIAKN